MSDKDEEKIVINNTDDDFLLDFTTSSTIGGIKLRFLILYVLIFWFGGFGSSILIYLYFSLFNNLLLTMLVLQNQQVTQSHRLQLDQLEEQTQHHMQQTFGSKFMIISIGV